MPPYDTLYYDPPAPVALVTLRDMSGAASVRDVTLLLDTGADITLLPREAVEHLGVDVLSGKDYELVGFDGSRSTAQAVDLEMIFLRKAFRGRYLLVDEDRGVLGRDVLASVILLLHGPRQEWREQEDDPPANNRDR